MAQAATPADALFNDVLAEAVTSPLKAAGFRKSGTNYHRRHGDTIQVVNIQSSRGSSSTEKEFYVNAGIAFDAICALAGVPVLAAPKEHECDERGMRHRIEALIPNAPDFWILRIHDDTRSIIVPLRDCLQRLVADFDKISGIEAYRAHPWHNLFRPAPVSAQILYLLGDKSAAWKEVQDLANQFADRQNANRAEWWVENLRLTGLAPT
jgi:hypothetical protein